MIWSIIWAIMAVSVGLFVLGMLDQLMKEAAPVTDWVIENLVFPGIVICGFVGVVYWLFATGRLN